MKFDPEISNRLNKKAINFKKVNDLIPPGQQKGWVKFERVENGINQQNLFDLRSDLDIEEAYKKENSRSQLREYL